MPCMNGTKAFWSPSAPPGCPNILIRSCSEKGFCKFSVPSDKPLRACDIEAAKSVSAVGSPVFVET